MWQYRTFPKSGSSVLPQDNGTPSTSYFGSPASSRVDFSAFINTMEDASFAYLPLLREHAARPLQGRALEYGGLYKALISQQADDEHMSRISVVEFYADALRSTTFASYRDFKVYLEANLLNESLRRLIVLEDLPVRFVCLLGSRLRIHQMGWSM
jgi:hypothetical protein